MSSPETKVFAIIPAHNEQFTVASVMRASLLAESIDGLVVVDDGSTDQTLRVISEEASYQKERLHMCEIASHAHNSGKAEALQTGVSIAKEIGGSSLQTLVFIDADLSPLSSRETAQNKKLSRVLVERITGTTVTEAPNDMDIFEQSLGSNIDAMVEPVLNGTQIMNIGMQHRTNLIDALRLALDWGALGGNRALSLELWDSMLSDYSARGLEVQGWEVEAALNTYCRTNRDEEGIKLNRSIGKFVMPDVVNVGSRVKAGGSLKGLARMTGIHSRALWGFVKFST